MTDQVTKEEFWDRMEDVQAGFLGLESGAARPVPMSHYVDRDTGVLWFITAEGTDIAEALTKGPASARYIVASGDGRVYARIDGRMQIVQNQEKLDELWNAVAAAWFDEGRQDDDIRLLRFDPNEAEVWANPGKLGFLYEIAKGQQEGVTPDMGAHGTLRFAA